MTTEVLTVGESQTEIDLDAVIGELDAAWDVLPEEALRTCQRNRDTVTPRLIEVLQEALRLGREGTVRTGNAHFFALFLLTEFEAKEALPVILELYALRDPILNGLIGDTVTEITRRVLAVFAADQPELIESLILNRELDEFVRWEAAAALCQLVRDERMPRSEAIERLLRQMRNAIEANDTWGVTIAVSELGDLNPLEVQDEIKAAFDQQHVDESIIDWNCIVTYSLHPDQPGTCPEFKTWSPGAIADTIEELRKWHCFTEAAREERRRAAEYRAAKKNLPANDIPYEHEDLPGDFSRPSYHDSLTFRNEAPHVGRNDPCPCGSGKKYKKCCLRASESL